MKRQDRKNLLEKVIRTSERKGADLSKILKGESVEQIVRKSARNFDRIIQRIKEQPKLQKDLEKYEKVTKPKNIQKIEQKKIEENIKKLSKKALRNINSSKLDKKVLQHIKGFETRKNFVEFQPFTQAKSLKEIMEMETKLYSEKKPLKSRVEELTYNNASEFIDRYFKTLELSASYRPRIEALKRAFGTRIDLLNDFIDTLISEQFKGLIDSDTMSYYDPEGFEDMIENRLTKAEQYVQQNLGLKLR